MADNVKFFEDNKEEPQVEETQPETVKIGDNEFSTDELEELVGKGKAAKEWEEKAGDTLDNLKSTFGKRGQTIGDLKKQVEELEQSQRQPEPQPGQQLTEEQQKQQILEEAKKFGILTKDEFDNMFDSLYQNRRSGEKLLARTQRVIRAAKKDGKPAVNEEKLLEFMSDPSNPSDPEKAYKLMFEKELDEWKEKNMLKAKKPGMITESKSTAGSKQPEQPAPPTRDNLEQRLSEFLKAQ